MAEQYTNHQARQAKDPSSDPIDPALRELLGGRAFPPGFDPWAIARRSRERRKKVRRGGGVLAALMAFGLVWLVADPTLTADYKAPAGIVKQVTLPDGTLAHLDSGASLSWYESDMERRVELHAGVVLFETAPDDKRGFVVESGEIEARPVGTIFAVSAGETPWAALVKSGRVQVSLENTDASLVLGPGQAATIDDGATSGIRTARVDVNHALAWQVGVLEFKNAPLAEVIRTLERYRPGRIILLNEQARSKRFDGVLSLKDIDQALSIVARAGGLKPVADFPMLLVLR